MKEYQKIPYEEYVKRVKNLQNEMEKENLDIFFCFGSEGVYRNLVYLANYWPAFEIGAIVIGKKGNPLVLNATESLEYAATSAFGLDSIRTCSVLDESEYPILNPGVILKSLKEVISEASGGRPVKRVGIGDYSTIPYPIYMKLQEACGKDAELINCDEIMIKLRQIKSEKEIELIEKACTLSEDAFERTLQKLNPSMTQYEMYGRFAAELYEDGGEGPGFAMGAFSGNLTRCSIGRPKHVVLGSNQVINVGMGCHYANYCGSYGRPFMFGKMPDKLKSEIEFLIEVHQKVAYDFLKPGALTGEVFEKYNDCFKKAGYDMAPGAPAHGLGIMEDEEPYFMKNGTDVLKENMVISVDNYFRTDEYGFRFENVSVITKSGARLLTERNMGRIELL